MEWLASPSLQTCSKGERPDHFVNKPLRWANRASRTCGSVPCDCGRNQGFGPTGSTQRRVSGDCSTTTSSRKNHANWHRNRRVGRARRGVGLSAFFFFGAEGRRRLCCLLLSGLSDCTRILLIQETRVLRRNCQSPVRVFFVLRIGEQSRDEEVSLDLGSENSSKNASSDPQICLIIARNVPSSDAFFGFHRGLEFPRHNAICRRSWRHSGATSLVFLAAEL